MQPITGRYMAAAFATLIALAGGASASTPNAHRRAVASSASHALNLTFEGGPAGFETALKRNLAVRARQFNVDPADYADELAQIHQIVADCMTVTADDWRTADTAQTAELHYAGRHGGPNPVARKMERLKYCDGRIGEAGPFGAKISDPSKPRAVGVGTSMSTFEGERQVPTPYTHIWVAFFGRPEDKDRFTITSTTQIPQYYQIIDARILRHDVAGAHQGNDAIQAANSTPDPATCVKFMRHYRDMAFDYLAFQNSCDRPYQVNAEARSGKIVSRTIPPHGQAQLQIVIATSSLFTGRYEAVEP
jgi:hypothetical protein